MRFIAVTIPESLAREFADYYGVGVPSGSLVGRVSRRIAATLPKPKPAAPQGLGAVVRDGGRLWVRIDNWNHPWFNPDHGIYSWRDWSDLSDAVEVLTPGWTGADDE